MRQLLLALLRRGPAHGYELKRAYDELFGAVWPAINVGQIYVTMGRLERDGLVTVHEEARADGPDRKVYELTTEGEKVLDDWLLEAVEPPTGRSDLVIKLVAAWISDPHAVAGLVGGHRQRCLEDLRSLDALAADAAEGSLSDLLVQGAALRLQAELRFLDLVDQRLDLTRPPDDRKGTSDA
jgi:DNA-binding PadR family transcriptional regulator